MTTVAVVMVPLPAQGHLNQLLHLSRLISGHHIPVYYAATAAHLRQATTRAHLIPPTDYITFHELPTISFENKPPNPNASNRFPSQVMPSLHASTRLREPVLAFVRRLSDMYGKVVVIYDSLMSYVVQDIAQRSMPPNSELYCFVSISAFASCAWEDIIVKEEIDDESDLLKDLPSTNGYYPTEFSDFLVKQRSIKNTNCGQIYNSNSVMEGAFLKLLGKTATEKIWGLGPFDLSTKDTMIESVHACLEWLDRQEAGSVMYVSFGTTASLPHEQVTEIAKGLERSEHKFLWVLRDADRGNIFDGEEKVRNLELPFGFEERMIKYSRGLIVRDWAPQLEILGHLAVGGFVSHCGWNSCLESLSNGVPVAAWPLHSDQPWNAALVTKVLKVGVMVKKWTPSSELVTCLEVESAVRRLMGDGEMRRRAKQLGHDIKKSVKEQGGDTRQEIDCFISRITQ